MNTQNLKTLLIFVVATIVTYNTSFSQTHRTESINFVQKENLLSTDDIIISAEVTNVEFEVSKPGYVTLDVFDSKGNKIEALVDGEMTAGTYNIYFKVVDGLREETYVFQLELDGAIQLRKSFQISNINN